MELKPCMVRGLCGQIGCCWNEALLSADVVLCMSCLGVAEVEQIEVWTTCILLQSTTVAFASLVACPGVKIHVLCIWYAGI
jgi:hypothetical protein